MTEEPRPDVAEDVRTSPWYRRPRVLLVVAGAAGAFLVAVAVAVLTGGDDETADEEPAAEPTGVLLDVEVGRSSPDCEVRQSDPSCIAAEDGYEILTVKLASQGGAESLEPGGDEIYTVTDVEGNDFEVLSIEVGREPDESISTTLQYVIPADASGLTILVRDGSRVDLGI